jgi:hypothetical protein
MEQKNLTFIFIPEYKTKQVGNKKYLEPLFKFKSLHI